MSWLQEEVLLLTPALTCLRNTAGEGDMSAAWLSTPCWRKLRWQHPDHPYPPPLCPAPWVLAGSVNKPLWSWWDSRGTVVFSACLFCLAVLSWVEHGPNSQNLQCADLSWVSDLLHGLWFNHSVPQFPHVWAWGAGFLPHRGVLRPRSCWCRALTIQSLL